MSGSLTRSARATWMPSSVPVGGMRISVNGVGPLPFDGRSQRIAIAAEGDRVDVVETEMIRSSATRMRNVSSPITTRMCLLCWAPS